MLDPSLTFAPLPPRTRWAVGVSGGADSVALLRLLHARGDLTLHVVHLDHQARGADSADDATFVADLASDLSIPCTVATRAEVEARLTPTSANVSARFRALRLALFREVVDGHALEGVVLAHHADDVAETVLHRLLRGSGVAGLSGIESRAVLSGMTVVRPLLECRRDALRGHLAAIGQSWREDASNASPRYARNRLRRVLAEAPGLTDALLDLAGASGGLREWTRSTAPVLPASFDAGELARLPEVLARESARRWLVDRGAPPDELPPAVLDRLVNLATDLASPSRQHFPGRVLVRRRGGLVFTGSPAEPGAKAPQPAGDVAPAGSVRTRPVAES